MPKPTKLHSRGKPNSMQKACKVEKNSSDGIDGEDSVRQFQLELCWCIQQLERFMNEKKGTEKQLQEAWKALTVLKNNNQPMVRKRQLMRTHLGDYRAKMAEEEKKLAKMASKIRISEVPDKPSGMNNLAAEQVDTGNITHYNPWLSPPPSQGLSSAVKESEWLKVESDPEEEVEDNELHICVYDDFFETYE